MADGSPDIEQFIKKLKDEGISAVGLTNYFNFKDEDFILKDKLNSAGIVAFLNLEVRLTNTNNSNQFLIIMLFLIIV